RAPVPATLLDASSRAPLFHPSFAASDSPAPYQVLKLSQQVLNDLFWTRAYRGVRAVLILAVVALAAGTVAKLARSETAETLPGAAPNYTVALHANAEFPIEEKPEASRRRIQRWRI